MRDFAIRVDFRDNDLRCNRMWQVCPVWMVPALQGKIALITQLFSTLLYPAFDRGD